MSSQPALESGAEKRPSIRAAHNSPWPSQAAPSRFRAETQGRRRSQLPLLTYKFGGSSLAGAERMLRSAALVCEARKQARVAVVVSAMRGVTDGLLSVGRLLADGALSLARGRAEYYLFLHQQVLRQLCLSSDEHARVEQDLQLLGRHLQNLPLRGRKEVNEALLARLASFGERFSACLFAAALAKLGVPAVPVCSCSFLLTSDDFCNAQPDIVQSTRNGRQLLQPLLLSGSVPVVTGFIGATREGHITTLGRNSSDYSGAIVAHVLNAKELVIWTDVDGIYTANPKAAPDARLLCDLTYVEAYALAANGAKVLHAEVLPLAAQTNMVVWVRNAFNPHARGTRIGPEQSSGSVAASQGSA